MYTSLKIENFRGFKSLEFPTLKRINLLVGKNNSGKTSVLEALFLLGAATDPIKAVTLAELRGQAITGPSLDSMWRSFFWQMEPKNRIGIRAGFEGEPSQRTLLISPRLDVPDRYGGKASNSEYNKNATSQSFLLGGLYFRYDSIRFKSFGDLEVVYDSSSNTFERKAVEREDFVRTKFLPSSFQAQAMQAASDFADITKMKMDDEVASFVSLIDARLRRITLLPEPTGPIVYIDLGLPRLLPLSVAGEGMVRLYGLVVDMISTSGGVLLADEIGQGLHHSAMPDYWRLVDSLAAKFNVQVFATTHSDEMIRAALSTIGGPDSQLALHRIDRDGDEHRVITYRDESVPGILEFNYEVRA